VHRGRCIASRWAGRGAGQPHRGLKDIGPWVGQEKEGGIDVVVGFLPPASCPPMPGPSGDVGVRVPGPLLYKTTCSHQPTLPVLSSSIAELLTFTAWVLCLWRSPAVSQPSLGPKSMGFLNQGRSLLGLLPHPSPLAPGPPSIGWGGLSDYHLGHPERGLESTNEPTFYMGQLSADMLRGPEPPTQGKRVGSFDIKGREVSSFSEGPGMNPFGLYRV
jgi:hypothetical protein